jgi:hypothetical protein
MDFIKKLNIQIDQLLKDYALLEDENNSLKKELELLKQEKNDIIINSEKMVDKIDKILNKNIVDNNIDIEDEY